MAFALLIIGAVMLITAVKNTQSDLAVLVKGDFTGNPNFVYWIVAIGIIGAVGYIPKLKPLSTAFLGLVILVLFLTKGKTSGVGGGLFSQLTTGLASTQSVKPAANAPTSPLGNSLSLPGLPAVASQLIH
jgi:hypothetical protein